MCQGQGPSQQTGAGPHRGFRLRHTLHNFAKYLVGLCPGQTVKSTWPAVPHRTLGAQNRHRVQTASSIHELAKGSSHNKSLSSAQLQITLRHGTLQSLPKSHNQKCEIQNAKDTQNFGLIQLQ